MGKCTALVTNEGGANSHSLDSQWEATSEKEHSTRKLEVKFICYLEYPITRKLFLRSYNHAMVS